MNLYFHLPRKSKNRSRGFINALKLLFVAFLFIAFFYCIRYFDTLSLDGASGSPKSVKIVPEVMACMVEIRGDKASGTGFIAELQGKNFIVTNLHVL